MNRSTVAADRKPSCNAPWTSLHLDPDGWATVCAANKREVLGHIGDAAVIDLWRGHGADAFRQQFASGSLGQGCELCSWQRGSGGDATMYARIYDHLTISDQPRWPSHLEFALSIDCNLECVMCNGGFSSAIRRRREGFPLNPSPYGDAFFEQVLPLLEHASATKFLGGEPFLSRENLRIWGILATAKRLPTCHVTTNGTIFNSRIADLLDQVPMSFAVSMDGFTAETVQRIRLGASLPDILTNLNHLQAHVESHGTDLSLTFCLMTENWLELPDFLRFGESRGLGVYVNTVLSPTRYSLYRLPRPRLREVLATMRDRDAEMEAALGRNLHVWKDQLTRLTKALDDPAANREVPVHFPALEPPAPVGTPTDAKPDQIDRKLRSWAGGRPVAHLSVDPTGTITAVEAPEIEGVNLQRLQGLGIDELFVWLQSAFGRLASSDRLRHDETEGDRILTFDRGHGPVEVRAISYRSDDGARWHLAVRTSLNSATTSPSSPS